VGADFMDFELIYDISLDPADPAFALKGTTAADLLESPNLVLVRRVLDSVTGNVRPNSTQIIAEFVTNFEVSFVVDTNSGGIGPPTLSQSGSINSAPEEVRSVIIQLGIRNPLEDSTLEFAANSDRTRFEVNENQKGSARVRHLRMEVPVMNVARRNL